MRCPECKTELKPHTNRCACGWSQRAAEEDWAYDRCRVEDGSGRRCLFPATFYPGNAKRNGGECRLHHGAHGASAADVIEESQRWYDARKAGRDVPFFYTHFSGRRVPGFPSVEQSERERVRLVAAEMQRRGLKTPQDIQRAALAGVAAIRAKRGLPSGAAPREPGEDAE